MWKESPLRRRRRHGGARLQGGGRQPPLLGPSKTLLAIEIISFLVFSLSDMIDD